MSYTQNEEIREQLDPSTVTLNKLLAENSNLIQTINEFQRKGRIHEAMKYQELLHKNLMYLSKEMEPSLVAELEENPPPLMQGQQQQPVSGPSSIPPPPSSSSGGTSIASPSRQPHSISSSQQNGHLSPYSSGHGPSPMRNGHQQQMPQQQQPLPPQEQPLQPQMPPPPGAYGMPPNGYPYHHMPPHQGPYMNGLPPGHMPPPR